MKGHKSGEVITLDAFKTGSPIDTFWRKRLRDSKVDNCVEVVLGKKVSIKLNAKEDVNTKTLK